MPGAPEDCAPSALKASASRLFDDAAPRNGNISRPLKSARYCTNQKIYFHFKSREVAAARPRQARQRSFRAEPVRLAHYQAPIRTPHVIALCLRKLLLTRYTGIEFLPRFQRRCPLAGDHQAKPKDNREYDYEFNSRQNHGAVPQS
jgi:hypothetical protein